MCDAKDFQHCIVKKKESMNAKELNNYIFYIIFCMLQLFLVPQPLQRWSAPLTTASAFHGAPQVTKEGPVSWAIFWRNAKRVAIFGP